MSIVFFVTVTGLMCLGAALIVALIAFTKYTDFMFRARNIKPNIIEDLSFELGDRWSKKNIEISRFFFGREYEALGDVGLNCLGSKIRKLWIAGIILACSGIILLAGKSLF